MLRETNGILLMFPSSLFPWLPSRMSFLIIHMLLIHLTPSFSFESGISFSRV
ncbi:hypothetical protein COCNU_01G000520 [Cocos nucifera]|uniref:Uncharacterized protein n=1 Tax=Cocos nucifera TaxID=13894 RepID=A0A8K0HTZ4_COCNU|nr:hypothetical protein COCNU_01G000520 [Cocos nucifera]